MDKVEFDSHQHQEDLAPLVVDGYNLLMLY